MFQRILVAVQPTIAPSLVPQAITLAKLHAASLLFVHICSAFDEGYAGAFYPGVDTLYPTLHNPILQNYAEEWSKVEARNLDWLKSLVTEAARAGVAAEFRQYLGEPGPLICQIARDEAVDLVLVGRRGRSNLSELLLGSVSNYVMHHAPCSVLTVQGTLAATPTTPKSSRKLANR
jgi:nucleotide-binding universal stress UspA family protein